MSPKLAQLLEEMTPQERAEVEAFAAFVIVRRHLQQPQLLTDDISVQELTELVATSGSFEWLNAEEEDIYSLEDGEAACKWWPDGDVWQSTSNLFIPMAFFVPLRRWSWSLRKASM